MHILAPSDKKLPMHALDVKQNIFLQDFDFEPHTEDAEMQVNTLLETFSANMKIQNRAAIAHLIDTRKFMGQ